MTVASPRYALITAARNEADYIHHALQSVVAQSQAPEIWVIVDDNSTDETSAIIKSFQREHAYIKLVQSSVRKDRNTAAKVEALQLALTVLPGVGYDYIGVIDADVSFGPTYFKELVLFFRQSCDHGLIGGKIYDVLPDVGPVKSKSSNESVAGAVHFFRKECFEKIGGYLPIAGGMEDGIAEICVRYYGWKTQSLDHLPVYHHKPESVTGRPVLRTRFRNGLTEYIVGFGLVYNFARALSRLSERPYIIGAVTVLAGYLWGAISRKPRVVSPELIQFMRREQHSRLLNRLFAR